MAFIHVSDPEAYSLQRNTGVVAGSVDVYMLSVHHQLHCLKQIHLSLVGLGFMDNPIGDGEQRHEMFRHVEHCFEYLRHGIICAGDATLEGPDPSGKVLSGNGVMHRCRAWDGLGGLETWRKLHQP